MTPQQKRRRNEDAGRASSREGPGTPAPAETAAEDAGEPCVAAFPVVGIGASAGGLEAVSRLLRSLPADTGAAFVVVQHLSPSRESELAAILSRETSMPVAEVIDEPEIVPNRVYVLPPGKMIVMAKGHLRLLAREVRGVQYPIDQFFRSLAEQQRHLAIGVVLSGTATDGTLGLEEIKAEGGITFAQDDSAGQGGMPQSAIASGCVDFVLSPEGIAQEILRIAAHALPAAPSDGTGTGPLSAADEPADAASAKAELAPILRCLRTATGGDFTEYKGNTLSRRIRRRMVLAKLSDLKDYERFVRDTPGEALALYQDILISVTSFFRDPEVFEALKTRVIPELLKNRDPDVPLRVWTVGCSTGEEAYSLAMLLSEAADSDGGHPPAQIFATDLNPAGIEHARAGLYPEVRLQDVSAERLRRFFVKHNGSFQVIKTLREMCLFSRHNMLADPPFSRMDLISCRNLLIYLEPALQKRVLPLLHYALRPGGFLLLGASETISPARDLFAVADEKHRLYSRQTGVQTFPRVPLFPIQNVRRGVPAKAGNPAPTSGSGTTAPRKPAASDSTDVHREADRLLVTLAPPAVLVDANFEIFQFHGNTQPYLVPAEGKASFALLKMARPGLAAPLRALLHRAQKENTAVREDGLSVPSKKGFRELTIEVLPVGGAPGKTSFLVVFKETPLATPARSGGRDEGAAKKRAGAALDHEAHISRLERELANGREHLQALVEQHEAGSEELQSANEEAQSANEELQSINEELATSREEIQSSNEELATVNDELHARNAELSRVNGDLTNLISSVHLAIVIVGRDLRIRRFSPMAHELLSIIATDIGRPITDVRMNLGSHDLGGLLTAAIDTLTPTQHEVQLDSGRWYMLFIRAYTNPDNRVDGAILSFVDIDAGKRVRIETEALNANLRRTEARLQRDLTASRQLQEISARLIGDEDLSRIYGELVEAAMVIMGAEMGSMQLVDDGEQVLRLVACRGLDAAFTETLAANRPETESSSAAAWKLGRRVVIPDVETCDFLVDTPALEDHRKAGIRAAQSTLLTSAGGKTLGVISTHWRHPQVPADHMLRLLDILAHMATDFMERRRLEDDLRRRGDELREADKSKTEFIAMLSHELRSPLAAIRGWIEILKNPRTKDADLYRKGLDVIDRNSKAQAALLTDLTDIHRIVAGKIRLDLAAIDLREVIDSAVDAISPTAAERGVHIERDPASPVSVVVSGDPTRLQQVLGNLLANAVKFTPRGGSARIALRRVGERAELVVSDTGKGITAAALPHIFGRFRQAAAGTSRQDGGLGLGLAISRQLIELHGGTIAAHSRGTGEGATFTVSLPILTAGEVPAPLSRTPADAENPVSLDGLLVLVVDDQVDAREPVRRALEDAGAETFAVPSVDEALGVIAHRRPDVIISDIAMPGRDGYELLRTIRASSATANSSIPAIALTAYAATADRERAMQAGFQKHLTKPVDRAVLIAAVAEVARAGATAGASAGEGRAGPEP